jgi:lysophospholipase L1-like esterase
MSDSAVALRRFTPALLLIAQLVVVALILVKWAYVTTYRLYLDRRVGGSESSAAAQVFDIESQRVVPQIVSHRADRIAFASHVGRDSVVHTEIRSSNRAAYSISWREGDAAQVLAAGVVNGTAAIAAPFPTGNGTIELASDGPVTWVDPRVVRSLQIGPHLILLSMLVAGGVIWQRRMHRTFFKVVTVVATFAMSCVAVEAGLRMAGDRAPGGVVSERHDLGEVTRDPRWEPSQRYERRLRAHVDSVNEWRYGDIVRMGYIPEAVSPGTLHRFRFVTDAEGFRNPVAREHFDIAALGDSFTDAMTMAVEASWPAQLEGRLHIAVQNYGTAGFGPQQELLVLRDYVARHRPSRVVLAFFAGNDIFDAEAFDDFERSRGLHTRSQPGWRIKDVVSRADTWFLVSAIKAGAGWLNTHVPTPAEAATGPSEEPVADASASATFDRGMFAVPVNGRSLRWALMPPYLNTLNFSEEDLRQRRGWKLTRAAILDMQRVTHDFGGELTVMFLPFKSQVYWPVLERTFSPEALASAIRFYLDGKQSRVDLDAMRRNRFAQNHLLHDLCEQAGIPFLDTTEALRQRFESGENVYFPDESHLNETGQAVVADALAAFLDAHR